MNDRYKFRVWDKKNNRYRNPHNYYIALSCSGKLFTLNCDGSYTESCKDDFIIEFCTGLKDKHGTLIFDGDKLNSQNDGKDGCDVWSFNEFLDLIVVWQDEYCCWSGLPDFDSDSVHSLERIEIIGNIHDTKQEQTND